MANNAYCDDSYLQAQQEQEEQEYELYVQAFNEHLEYLEILAKGEENGK